MPAMSKGAIGTIVKLLLASLAVGLVMHWLEITPRSLIANFGETVARAYNALEGFAGWAVDYVLLGALVVVPIWLVVFLLGRFRRK
jgi:predicted histidine transporter YuiF (NhaC family)